MAYVLFFFLCSLLGWVMEVAVKAVQYRHFINRGFLVGPVCPIYGVGSVLMAWLLPRWADGLLPTFLLAMLLCGALEYLTGWLMEKLFHARWWDYSQKRFHLNGRVCAENLLAFGALGVLIVKVLWPVFDRLISPLSPRTLNILCSVFIALLLADITLSVHALRRIRLAADTVAADSTEAITRAVRERLRQDGIIIRRAVNAFPQARLYSTALMRRLHHARSEVRRKVQAVNERLRADWERIDARRGR